MGDEINDAKKYIIQIFKELKEKYEDYNCLFGAVFYRDKNEYFPLTNNMEDLRNKISTIKAYGVGIYQEVRLEVMK